MRMSESHLSFPALRLPMASCIALMCSNLQLLTLGLNMFLFLFLSDMFACSGITTGRHFCRNVTSFSISALWLLQRVFLLLLLQVPVCVCVCVCVCCVYVCVCERSRDESP